MGDAADLYDMLAFDQDEHDDDEPLAVCKFCGSVDVFWLHHRGKWLLKNVEDGTAHNCRKVARPDEFDVL